MTTPTDHPGGQPLKQILEHIDKRIKSEIDKRGGENARGRLKFYLLAIAVMAILSALTVSIHCASGPLAPASDVVEAKASSKMVTFSPDMSRIEDRLAALSALLVMDNGFISKQEHQALNAFFVGRYKAEPQHPIGSIPRAVLDNKASAEMFDSNVMFRRFLGYQALINPSDKSLSALIDVDMPAGGASYEIAHSLEQPQLQDYRSTISTLLLNDIVSATKTESEGKMLIEYAESWQAFINTLVVTDEVPHMANPEDQFSVMAKEGQYQQFTNDLRNRLIKRTLVPEMK